MLLSSCITRDALTVQKEAKYYTVTSHISSSHFLLLSPKYIIYIPEKWKAPWKNLNRSRGRNSAFWLLWFSIFSTGQERQGVWITSCDWRKNKIWISFCQPLLYWKLFSKDSHSWKVALARYLTEHSLAWVVCWILVEVKFHADGQSVMQISAYNLHALNVPSVAECENRLVVLNWA